MPTHSHKRFVTLCLIAVATLPVSLFASSTYADEEHDHWTLPVEQIWVPWESARIMEPTDPAWSPDAFWIANARAIVAFIILGQDLGDISKEQAIRKLSNAQPTLDDFVWILDYELQQEKTWTNDSEVFLALFNAKCRVMTDLGDYLVRAVWALPDNAGWQPRAFGKRVAGGVFDEIKFRTFLVDGKRVPLSSLPGFDSSSIPTRLIKLCGETLSVKAARGERVLLEQQAQVDPGVMKQHLKEIEGRIRRLTGAPSTTYQDCKDCKGYGKTGTWTTADCSQCSGKGSNYMDLLGVCQTCNGRGNSLEVVNSSRCGTCHGSGVKQVPGTVVRRMRWKESDGVATIRFSDQEFSMEAYDAMSGDQKLDFTWRVVREAPLYRLVDEDRWLEQREIRDMKSK